jgi:hypothetical protein
MRRLVSVVAFVLLVVPGVARAQTPPAGQPPPSAVPTNEFRDNYLALSIGPLNFNDKWNIQNKPKVFGIALDFWQRGILGADLDFGYSRNILGTSGVLAGPNLMTLTFGAIIGPWATFGHSAIRPYFAIGGGLQRASAGGFTQFGSSSANRGVIHLGGGAVFYIVKSFGVRVDFRIFKDVGSKDILGEDGWGITGLQFKRLTFGAVFAF